MSTIVKPLEVKQPLVLYNNSKMVTIGKLVSLDKYLHKETQRVVLSVNI